MNSHCKKKKKKKKKASLLPVFVYYGQSMSQKIVLAVIWFSSIFLDNLDTKDSWTVWSVIAKVQFKLFCFVFFFSYFPKSKVNSLLRLEKIPNSCSHALSLQQTDQTKNGVLLPYPGWCCLVLAEFKIDSVALWTTMDYFPPCLQRQIISVTLVSGKFYSDSFFFRPVTLWRALPTEGFPDHFHLNLYLY